MRTGISRSRSQRITLFAGTVIADVAHGVNRLSSWTGRDHHGFTLQATGVKQLAYPHNEFVDRHQPTRAGFATSLNTVFWPQNFDAALAQGRTIGLGRRFGPHGLIHRRRHSNWALCGKANGGQQVVALATCKAREEIGAGGCNENEIRPACQLNMTHHRFGIRIEQIQVDRMVRKCLHG